MRVQNRDKALLQTFSSAAQLYPARKCYRVEISPATLDEQCRQIEQVIQFALDTLGAYHLDVRVITTPCIGTE